MLEGANGTVETSSGDAGAEAPTVANTEFNGSLPESIRTNESLYGFEDVGGLANSYIEQGTQNSELQSQLTEAQGKVPVVPASADGYEINFQEGYQTDEGVLGEFKNMALTEGLSTKQVQAVMDFDAQRVANNTQSMQAANEKVVADFKQEWGADYEKNLALADRAIIQVGGEEFSEALKSSGLSHNPELVKGFLKLGQAMGEDSMHTGGTNTGSAKRPTGIDGKPMLKFDM